LRIERTPIERTSNPCPSSAGVEAAASRAIPVKGVPVEGNPVPTAGKPGRMEKAPNWHPQRDLGALVPRSARHRPRRSTVECGGECTRYALVQSGAGHRSAGGHTTADSHVYTVRHDRLQADNSTRLSYHYSGDLERRSGRKSSVLRRTSKREWKRYLSAPA
jgi:hypothetical protein